MDGSVPCLNHLIMQNCNAQSCNRSHDASKHTFTNEERAGVKDELTRRKKNRENNPKGKGDDKGKGKGKGNGKGKSKYNDGGKGKNKDSGKGK